jgi:outer membrane receptor protein involved in Fe transport
VTAAEHDSFELATWFSGPLVDDRLTLFLAAGHRRYGGEYHNARDGSTVGGEESSEATGKLYWSPSSALDVTLKLSLQDTDDDHFAIYLQPRTLNNCCFRSADAPRAREYFVGEAQSVDGTRLFTDLLDIAGGAGTELSRALATLDLRWTLESGQTFASLTGIVDDELRRGFDSSYAAYDPLPFAPGSFTRVDRLEQTDRSQELRLSSRADAAIRWTTGLYYYEGVLGEVTDERVFLDGSGSVVIAPNFGALTRDEIENIAVFGGAEWDVGERWTAGVELRWAADEVTVASRTNDDTRQLLDRFHARFSGFTPRFTLTHQADPRLSYYLSIAKGTNPGDFNSDVPSLPDGSPDERFRAVDEEQLWSYEAGLKGRWWQDRATGSASAYHVDVEDQQLTQIVELADGGTASIIQNVGRTQVYGLELQLSLALPQHLGLNATYAYTHAEIREHISTDEADLRGSDGSPGQNRLLGDVAGKRVPRVPEHSASLALRYDRPLADWGRWYLNADYTYESSRFAQEHNLIETGERSLVGLGAGIAGDQWEAGIWVANALDDDTPVDVVRYFDRRSGSLPAFPQQGSSRPSSSPRGFALTLPRGRQARATIRYRF